MSDSESEPESQESSASDQQVSVSKSAHRLMISCDNEYISNRNVTFLEVESTTK